jgi:hypothetical protein
LYLQALKKINSPLKSQIYKNTYYEILNVRSYAFYISCGRTRQKKNLLSTLSPCSTDESFYDFMKMQ